MPVHMERNYRKHIDWTCRLTAITTTVLAAMVITTSPAKASSVPAFSDQSDHHSSGTDYFKFKVDDHGPMNTVIFDNQGTDKIRKGPEESDDGHNAINWGNHDYSNSSRDGQDDDGKSHYTSSHDGTHGDFSWLPDHGKSGKNGHKDKRHDSRDDRDHHDYWDDKGNYCKPPAAVPVPAAVWLFGSGLAGMFGLASRRRAKKT
jgi:hypothetical protein